MERAIQSHAGMTGSPHSHPSLMLVQRLIRSASLQELREYTVRRTELRLPRGRIESVDVPQYPKIYLDKVSSREDHNSQQDHDSRVQEPVGSGMIHELAGYRQIIGDLGRDIENVEARCYTVGDV